MKQKIKLLAASLIFSPICMIISMKIGLPAYKIFDHLGSLFMWLVAFLSISPLFLSNNKKKNDAIIIALSIFATLTHSGLSLFLCKKYQNPEYVMQRVISNGCAEYVNGPSNPFSNGWSKVRIIGDFQNCKGVKWVELSKFNIGGSNGKDPTSLLYSMKHSSIPLSYLTFRSNYLHDNDLYTLIVKYEINRQREIFGAKNDLSEIIDTGIQRNFPLFKSIACKYLYDDSAKSRIIFPRWQNECDTLSANGWYNAKLSLAIGNYKRNNDIDNLMKFSTFDSWNYLANESYEKYNHGDYKYGDLAIQIYNK